MNNQAPAFIAGMTLNQFDACRAASLKGKKKCCKKYKRGKACKKCPLFK